MSAAKRRSRASGLADAVFRVRPRSIGRPGGSGAVTRTFAARTTDETATGSTAAGAWGAKASGALAKEVGTEEALVSIGVEAPASW